MKQFWVFTRKEFYHILRDRWTSIILLVLPIVMILLFGFGIVTEIKNTKFGVLDLSRDVASRGMVDKLESSEYFSYYDHLESKEDVERLFREGKVGLIMVFSPNFHEQMLRTGEAQIQLITDGTDPNTAFTLTNYASRLIQEYQSELNGISKAEVPFSIRPETKLLYNPTLEGVFNTTPGVIGMILILICVMMTAVSIAREKELGTMEVILVSPLHPLTIILSKVVPYFTLSLFNLSTILAISHFILGIPIHGSLALVVLVSLIYIFVSLAIGLIISSIAETQLVALLFSVMSLILPVILLSGMMFPIENMPIILQGIAHLIPAKWYIDALRIVMIEGQGFGAIVFELGILSFMATVLIAISYRKFKIRLE